jgi:hypothetical protein
MTTLLKVATGLGIEVAAGAALDDGDADVRRGGGLVGALGGDGVVDVGHGGQARELVDALAGQAVGVALAVPALVVVADHRAYEERQVLAEHVDADDRVLAHDLPLGRRRACPAC